MQIFCHFRLVHFYVQILAHPAQPAHLVNLGHLSHLTMFQELQNILISEATEVHNYRHVIIQSS
jgi:hypothetical protein